MKHLDPEESHFASEQKDLLVAWPICLRDLELVIETSVDPACLWVSASRNKIYYDSQLYDWFQPNLGVKDDTDSFLNVKALNKKEDIHTRATNSRNSQSFRAAFFT